MPWSSAGLYEMPLQLVESGGSGGEDVTKMDEYLEHILGFPLPGPSCQVVERKLVGSVSHTFSHIQLTLRVQLLVLKVSLPMIRFVGFVLILAAGVGPFSFLRHTDKNLICKLDPLLTIS